MWSIGSSGDTHQGTSRFQTAREDLVYSDSRTFLCCNLGFLYIILYALMDHHQIPELIPQPYCSIPDIDPWVLVGTS